MRAVFFLVASMAFGSVPDNVVYYYCAETGVPLYIAHGLLLSESSNTTGAINGNSMGPWQLNTQWHEYFRWRFNAGREFSEFDNVVSTRIALRYLAHLHEWLGTWRKALVYYKTGGLPVSARIKEVVEGILNG